MDLPFTRAMVNAVIDGSLTDVENRTHPVFRVAMPIACPGVPSELLNPRDLWSDGEAYDRAAAALGTRFQENFTKFGDVDPAIAAAGPLL